MTHPPTRCSDVHALLPLHVGGDLEEQARGGVEEHLAGCGTCRDSLQRAREARAALLGLREAVAGPGPDLWPGIRAALDLSGTAPVREAASRWTGGRILRWRPIATTAAAAAVFLIGWMAWGPAGAGTPDGAPGASPAIAEGTRAEGGSEVPEFSEIEELSGSTLVDHRFLRPLDEGERPMSWSAEEWVERGSQGGVSTELVGDPR